MRVLLTVTAAISIFAQQALALPTSAIIAQQNTTYFGSMIHELNHHKRLDTLELKSIYALHQWHSHLPQDHKSSLGLSLEHTLLASISRAYDDCYWNETNPEYFAIPTANQSLLCSDVHMETGQNFASSKELAHWTATVKMGIATLRKRVTAAWMEKSETKVLLPVTWVPVYHPSGSGDANKRDMEAEKRETTDADGDVQVLKPTHTKNIFEHAATNLLCILGISRTICHD